MNHAFNTYHPIVNFGFFCGVIGIGIFMIHPVFLAIGIVGSIAYSITLGGRSTLKFIGCFLVPMIIVVVIINPLTNHRGSTVLFNTRYWPVTFESLMYGLLAGLMIASVILWFVCYNKVMTTDKFVYLFGRIVPSTSLIFSMVMRFVPNFKMQIRKISRAQKGIGRDVSSGNLREKCRHGMKIISIMFTWALENSIHTADSMRSRGYGMMARSTFSIYRFDRRDAVALAVIIITAGIVITGGIAGRCTAKFFPDIVLPPNDVFTLTVYVSYAILCFMPCIIEGKEVLKWKFMK